MVTLPSSTVYESGVSLGSRHILLSFVAHLLHYVNSNEAASSFFKWACTPHTFALEILGVPLLLFAQELRHPIWLDHLLPCHHTPTIT